MKILLVEDEPDLREMIALTIESAFNAEVKQAASGNEAIQILKNESDFSCVVCDYNMNNGNGGDVFQYLLDNKSTTPFILCSSDPAETYKIFREHKIFGSVVKPGIFEPLSKLIEKLSPPPITDSYFRIKIQTAIKIGPLVSEIYIKLGPEKYVRVFHKNAVIEPVELQQFSAKEMEFFYLKRLDANLVLKELSAQLLSLDRAKNAAPQVVIPISTSTMEIVSELSNTIGFSMEAQELTKACVSLALKTIQQNPKLAELCDQFTIDQESYQASHSILLAHVACGIASLMGWTSESTFYKLSLAAFLHDISLSNDKIAQIQSLQEFSMKRTQFSEQDMRDFMKHPEASAEIASSFSELPPDVSTIIAQHHERPDGTGFPKSLNQSKIAPLSCVMIIAHQILLFSPRYDQPGRTLQDYARELSVVYDKGLFHKTISAVLNSMESKAA